MKFALHHDQLILLHDDTYDQLAQWRRLAAQRELHCPECGDSLQLVAGLSFKPYFFHREQPDCAFAHLDEPPEALSAALASRESAAAALPAGAASVSGTAGFGPSSAASGEPKELAVGTFRLPQGRPIGPPAEPTPAPQPLRKRLKPRVAIKPVAERFETPLYPEQQRAVTTTEGPLLILAGAGSGKTRVMTERTAYLLREKGVDPRSVMVVTFTTKAAEEMKQRLAARLPLPQVRALITGTFHSIFYRMLMHHQPERWNQGRLLKQNWQKRRLLQETGILPETGLAHLKDGELDEALDVISRWKNDATTPEHLARLTLDGEAELHAQALYAAYEQAKQQHGWFDFDDMLCGCYELLRDDAQIRQRYQERIGYIMIDEFQDINRIQYETIKLLAAPQNNLCVIGDDDQSIYGFRGSKPDYILGFTDDYPDARRITLEVNFRSRSSIVSLGYSLIGHNRTRWPKELKSFHAEEGDSYLFYPVDEDEQASLVTDEMMHRVSQGQAAWSDFAVLFRTYESARPLVEHLLAREIPFQAVWEEEPFYERQAVRWALAYLRLAAQPDDAAAMREIWPTLYLGREQWNTLRSLSILEDKPLLHTLPLLPELKVYQRQHLQKVAALLTELPMATPAQALELVYEDGKLRDYVKKRGKERSGSEQNRSAEELQQLLHAAKRHATLPAFLDYIAAMAAKEKELRRTAAPPGTDAVQVMSIHRAKGLEFDTVFLLDLVEGAIPHEFTLDELRKGNPEALEEERRLLYVAITRAKRQLYLGLPQERFGRKTRVSRFIAEMGI